MQRATLTRSSTSTSPKAHVPITTSSEVLRKRFLRPLLRLMQNESQLKAAGPTNFRKLRSAAYPTVAAISELWVGECKPASKGPSTNEDKQPQGPDAPQANTASTGGEDTPIVLQKQRLRSRDGLSASKTTGSPSPGDALQDQPQSQPLHQGQDKDKEQNQASPKGSNLKQRLLRSRIIKRLE